MVLIWRSALVSSGFHGIYDVEHFIKSLKYDVHIVDSLPDVPSRGKNRKMKAFQVSFLCEWTQHLDLCIVFYFLTLCDQLPFHFHNQIKPPRDASVSWYKTTALEKMREHGAIYLTPFSHRLEEEIDDPEYKRLRCRVNYHALRFKPHIMKLSSEIVNKIQSQGHFQ